MKTNLYLIRHGESEANKINAFLGHGDLDLTDLGVTQAKLTAKFFDGIEADAIYSSDLKRAYHTSLETANRKNLPVTKSKALREISAGKWDFMPFKEIGKVYPDTFYVWRNDLGNARPDGGESVRELQSRFIAEVERIAKANSGGTVLIFTHATPVRVISAHAKGIALKDIETLPWPTNSSVTHLTYQDGKFQMVDYSLDAHLGNLVTALKDD